MTEISAEVEIPAPLAAVWDTYFDPLRWSLWVDGFAQITAVDGYPEAGGTLRWESGPAGRGRVSERVLEHEPRRVHRVAYDDPESRGELETRFEMLPADGDGRRTRVSQKLTYELRRRGPFAALTDRLFIRAQMRGSLLRSLGELRLEVAGTAAVAGD